MSSYYVFILASKRNGTFYVGMTSDLIRRIYEHKHDLVEGFTSKYKVHDLVYYEQCENVETAIQREKQLKFWYRKWKLRLIETQNPDWKDLYSEITWLDSSLRWNDGLRILNYSRSVSASRGLE